MGSMHSAHSGPGSGLPSEHIVAAAGGAGGQGGPPAMGGMHAGDQAIVPLLSQRLCTDTQSLSVPSSISRLLTTDMKAHCNTHATAALLLSQRLDT